MEAVNSCYCPAWLVYGARERRRSRNFAAMGMFGALTLLALGGVVMPEEKTLLPPAARPSVVISLRARLSATPEVRAERPVARKLLAEASAFEIPREARSENVVTPEPAMEKKPVPASRVEPKAQPKVRPKNASKPKPVAKQVPKAKKKQTQVREAGPMSSGTERSSETVLGSGGTAVAMSGTAGVERSENDRKSAALAVILQAVEKHKRYPRQGRRTGAEGSCVILARVTPDGRVDACSLEKGSGRVVLDAAARKLCEKLVGLRVGAPGGFTVLIPVHYRLTDG